MPSLETIIGVLATLGICFGLHSIDIDYQLAKQKSQLTASCDKNKQITTKVDNVLQNGLSGITTKLNASLVLQPQCVTPISATSNSTTRGTKYAGYHGISANWLRQYAATAETYRVKLQACQTLLTEERQ